MGTRRLPAPDEYGDETVIETESEDITALQDDIDAELFAIKSEFDKDDNEVSFEVRVYKTVPNSAELEYLFTCTPAELPILDRVRDEFGGGIYQTRVYKITPKGKRLARRFGFRIGSPRPGMMAQHQPRQNDDLAGVVRAMMEQNQAQMKQQQDLMLQLLTRQQPQQQQGTMAEMMAGMAAMMGAVQKFVPQQQPGGNGVEMLVQGITLAKELMGDGGNGSERNLYDTLTETVKTFGPVMAKAVTNPNPPQYRPTASPTPQRLAPPQNRLTADNRAANIEQPKQTNPTQQQQEAPPVNKIQMMMFKGYLSQLVQKAREDADPGLYAEIILDNLDDEKIAFFLTGPNGIENLINVDPAVSTVRPWFERLRTEVSAMLTDDDESAMVEETQPEPVNHNDGAELPTSDS